MYESKEWQLCYQVLGPKPALRGGLGITQISCLHRKGGPWPKFNQMLMFSIFYCCIPVNEQSVQMQTCMIDQNLQLTYLATNHRRIRDANRDVAFDKREKVKCPGRHIWFWASWLRHWGGCCGGWNETSELSTWCVWGIICCCRWWSHQSIHKVLQRYWSDGHPMPSWLTSNLWTAGEKHF